MLWMQHSEWTRMAFTAIIFKNPDEEEVLKRLLRNPVDFACFLNVFFDKNMVISFENLLTEHLELAGELVRATMDEDTMGAENINERLYENADELSALLALANPYWQYDEWRTMFYKHLDLAKKMASEMIHGDYEESIRTYDHFEAEVMLMADFMIEGLLNYNSIY